MRGAGILEHMFDTETSSAAGALSDAETLDGSAASCSGALLLGLDRAQIERMDRNEAVAVALGAERLIRQVQALQAVALSVLPLPGEGQTPKGCMPAVDEVACELSVGYGVSEESVHSRIWEARQLCRRLRLTWEALFDGRFSSYAARQVVEAADLLDDDAEAARLEQLVVPRGSHDL